MTLQGTRLGSCSFLMQVIRSGFYKIILQATGGFRIHLQVSLGKV